jgi:hypothetical protein
MNADLKQLLSSLFPLCTVLYKARFTNALSLYQLDYQLYVSGTILLHIKCIFNQWMLVLPRERKTVLLRWWHSTVRPFVKWFLSQLATLKAKCASPEKAQTTLIFRKMHRNPSLIEFPTGNFELTIIRSLVH